MSSNSPDRLDWKHGESSNGGIVRNRASIEYEAWGRMLGRCYNPSNPSYKHYGGRGIVVCDSWQNSFANFLTDMGRKPTHEHSLGRKNNNGNYEPNNCEWQTSTKQSRNTRTVKLSIQKAREIRRLWEHTGLTQRELARKFGVTQSAIWKVVSKKDWKEGY